MTFGELKIGDTFDVEYEVGDVTFIKIKKVFDTDLNIYNAVYLDFDNGSLAKFEDDQEVFRGEV